MVILSDLAGACANPDVLTRSPQRTSSLASFGRLAVGAGKQNSGIASTEMPPLEKTGSV